MKTRAKRITGRWIRKTSHRQLSVFAVLLSGAIILASSTAEGGSATWQLDPTSNDWNTAANWTPNTIPNLPRDTATFAVSHVTDVSLAEHSRIAAVAFPPGASAYSLTADLFFKGSGVVNNSGITQRINAIGAFGFDQTATAGRDVIYTLNGGASDGMSVTFKDRSVAGTATFIVNGASPGGFGGFLTFEGFASAAQSTIILNGSTDGGDGGLASFTEDSDAGASTIVVNPGALLLFEGGISGHAGGGNALIRIVGGRVAFQNTSYGDNVKVEMSEGGFLQGQKRLYLGSLAGEGTVSLAAGDLTIGINGLDTEFSGVVREKGEPHGAVLTKTGLGTLTLSGLNLYTGGTVVDQGTLLVKTQRGSATGPGPVGVDVGTLGGRSNLSGAVTIGTGKGRGAYLAPGLNGVGVLVIRNTLTFRGDGHYNWELNLTGGKGDTVRCQGVTIESGAHFDYSGIGHQTLAPGTVFTVIDNQSQQPISGTFANLPEGATINADGNTLQATYEGGDGNDLTLTVVP